jgi:hypothetical protein
MRWVIEYVVWMVLALAFRNAFESSQDFFWLLPAFGSLYMMLFCIKKFRWEEEQEIYLKEELRKYDRNSRD